MLYVLHHLEPRKRFTELGREEKGEGGDRGDQEDKRGKSKGERQIQPVISSLSVLHRLEHTEIQSWIGKRRGREEIEATWWRKKESPKGERAVKPVILLPSKNG